MSIKLSDIEKALIKQIVIVDGKPEWVENKLNGNITFRELDNNLLKKLNDDVIQKLEGRETEAQIAYKMLGYITDIEVDLPLEKFEEMNESKNSIIVMLTDGVVRVLEELINYSEKNQDIQNRISKIKKDHPQMIDTETKEEKIERLTKEMSICNDVTKRKELFNKLSEIYAEG